MTLSSPAVSRRRERVSEQINISIIQTAGNQDQTILALALLKCLDQGFLTWEGARRQLKLEKFVKISVLKKLISEKVFMLF